MKSSPRVVHKIGSLLNCATRSNNSFALPNVFLTTDHRSLFTDIVSTYHTSVIVNHSLAIIPTQVGIHQQQYIPGIGRVGKPLSSVCTLGID